jgi:hypothetical protein
MVKITSNENGISAEVDGQIEAIKWFNRLKDDNPGTDYRIAVRGKRWFVRERKPENKW